MKGILYPILISAGIGLCWFAGCEQNSNAGLSPDKSNQQSLPAVSSAVEQLSTQIIAYYFHRTFRCPTCRAIEANAEQVIKKNFAQELADERLIWIPFNLDEPGGKELEKEFDVSISTLVIAKMKGDNNTEYKKLEKVWDLLGDSDKFSQYITEEIKKYLQ
jgi:hypothetical protein